MFSEAVSFLFLIFTVIPAILIYYFDHFSSADADIFPVL